MRISCCSKLRGKEFPTGKVNGRVEIRVNIDIVIIVRTIGSDIGNGSKFPHSCN